MKSSARAALFAGSLLLACSNADEGVRAFEEPLPPRASAADAWELVVGEEFDSGALDSSLWNALSGDLVHSKTLNSASPSRIEVRDGSLLVSAVPTPDDPVFPYTAGRVETRGLFAQTYGKIEFRARAPYAPGLWFAVWGRPWVNAVPEIDVEFLAENVSQAWFVNHWDLPPVPADDRRRFVTVDGMDITDFHTYSITWTEDLVEWQIDGKAYMRETGRGVPHEPMFWVVNAWVGGWGGTPSKNTIFPSTFELDWFRVYRLKQWPVEPSIRVNKEKTEYAKGDVIDIQVADLDRNARVEVWEDGALLTSIPKPPFRLRVENLPQGPHALALVGTDGLRTAKKTIDIVVR
jgi:beta-glucanase (GH16 family)